MLQKFLGNYLEYLMEILKESLYELPEENCSSTDSWNNLWGIFLRKPMEAFLQQFSEMEDPLLKIQKETLEKFLSDA